MSRSNNLKLDDPVTIEYKPPPTSPSPKSPKSSITSPTILQGVVAFLGPISFADGDDWVGVRLTGDSIGHGKNDGSVYGVRYFEGCGTNGGAFVRKGVVRARTASRLGRLEELRLKRELLKGSGNSNDSMSVGSGRGLNTGSRSSTARRLEELRLKRELKNVNRVDSTTIGSVASSIDVPVNNSITGNDMSAIVVGNSKNSTLKRLEEIRLKRQMKDTSNSDLAATRGSSTTGSGKSRRSRRSKGASRRNPRASGNYRSSSSLASLNEDEVSVQSMHSMQSMSSITSISTMPTMISTGGSRTGSSRTRLDEVRKRRQALRNERNRQRPITQ